jgi:hypothetical protein
MVVLLQETAAHAVSLFVVATINTELSSASVCGLLLEEWRNVVYLAPMLSFLSLVPEPFLLCMVALVFVVVVCFLTFKACLS